MTALFITTLVAVTLYVVQGEINVRKRDRQFARQLPGKLALARMDYRIALGCAESNDHLTPEDRLLLKKAGWTPEPAGLREIAPAEPAREPIPEPISGDVLPRARNTTRPRL